MIPTSERSDSSVGLRLIEVDHREIEGLIQDLQPAVAIGRDKNLNLHLLVKLSGFARMHFALEEGMMSATDYPSVAAHVRSHQSLFAQLEGFIALYRKDRLSLDQESLAFLFLWYAAHSQNEDARYADYLVVRDARRYVKELLALPGAATPARA
jgi:hemerythrin-like metal-binding protein